MRCHNAIELRMPTLGHGGYPATLGELRNPRLRPTAIYVKHKRVKVIYAGFGLCRLSKTATSPEAIVR